MTKTKSRHYAGTLSFRDVRPSAMPSQVRILDLPPPVETVHGLGIRGLAGVVVGPNEVPLCPWEFGCCQLWAGTERTRVRACSGSAGQQDQGLASAIGHVGTPAGYDLDQALIRENPDSLASSEPRHPVLLHQACLRGDRPSRRVVAALDRIAQDRRYLQVERHLACGVPELYNWP